MFTVSYFYCKLLQTALGSQGTLRKGFGFMHKLSYSDYFGFQWPVVMSWD